VRLLTIGAFARAARLSPKALRLYDELGLLPPAAVDGESGYRFYHPDQLERARLVAWLRRLGMPLARVRTVLSLAPSAAAADIAAYWAEVLAQTASRQQLAGFLIDYLNGRGSTVTSTGATAETAAMGIRYAARTETGAVRTSNQDVAYAGSRLLAVADGMGGAAGGTASAAAVEALKPLQAQAIPPGELLSALAEAAGDAQRAIEGIDPTQESEPGTTLTAMLWSGSQLALVHIGDTRAYLVRGGDLFQITHDHTWVQSLVDDGKLTPAEAQSHPQRALLVRAITPGGGHDPDLSLHDAVVGDRYLLCSDGLTQAVGQDAVRAALTAGGSPQETVDRLIELAYAGGAPDNIACVVADVVPV
jgi:protein phosphatase